ncbi:MAG: ClbS/DfsB family four-helix bundle protein [Anaerolineales bacterium]|jgi:hypothetical protein
MSELPFDVPTNKAELRSLVLVTREKFASMWKGLPEEAMTRRPGPTEVWSVKDIIAHICFWESFAISRITILAAGEKLYLLTNFDALNKQAHDQFHNLPLEAVFAMFESNLPQIEALIDAISFEEWADETRENFFKGHSLMRMLGGNTFGHYFEHMDDLKAFREKVG